jgi:D-sedoheptulose 7-phosphate isomerase
MLKHLQQAFLDANEVINTFCNNQANIALIAQIAKQLAAAIQAGNKIMIAGNGGSACDALHFAEEFTGRYRKDRKALPVLTFSDVGHITCVGNDFGFEQIFARGIEAFGKPNDWFIALSTSGNSVNIIEAIKAAKNLQIHTFALLGKDGGVIAGTCNYEIIAPGKTADRIQELHMTILHILIEGIERILFPNNYAELFTENLSTADKF